MIVDDPTGRLREVRWSAARKAKAVLRILEKEPIDQVAAQTGVPASTLVRWHERFVAGGTSSLKGIR
jgi:transposase-like protein